MSSREADETTIANYIASQDEFRNTHADTMLKLTTLSDDMKLIASRCARQVELEMGLEAFPTLTSNKLQCAEALVQAKFAELKALDRTAFDYPAKNSKLSSEWKQAARQRDQLKQELEAKYAAPLQKELDEINNWFQASSQLRAIKANMVLILVELNKALPPGDKFKTYSNSSIYVSTHIDKLNAEMRARIAAHADTLTHHVCANMEITLLLTSYQMAKFNLDDKATDPEPLRVALAQAIRNGMSECPICCENIIIGQSAITKCKHTFHKTCLDAWLNRGKSSCPYCRREVLRSDLVFK